MSDLGISDLAQSVLACCRARGWMIATAESCTGGLVAGALTDIAGSSDVVERGVVTYSNAAKVDLLGVAPATLKAHGAVSQQVAQQMAAGVLARAPVQMAVSITGIAGPGGSENKPEGRVCFGLATQAAVSVETQDFGAIGRSAVRAAATRRALELMVQAAQP